MQEGVFALIDCLGFKGIWKREKDAALILNKFVQIDKTLVNLINTFKGTSYLFSKIVNPQIILLSDTIAISIPYTNTGISDLPIDVHKGALIDFAAILASKIIQLFIEDEPHLTLRGCITYGAHLMKNNFIVGPAVDEAAEYYEIADGAFVWLHPNAVETYEKYKVFQKTIFKTEIEKFINTANLRHDPELSEKLTIFTSVMSQFDSYLENFDMPIKGGSSLQCSIVNPLIIFKDEMQRQNIIQNYLKSFHSSKIDIIIKQQNTMKMINEANCKCQLFDANEFDFEEMRRKLGIEKFEDTK